jgi:hypothetical protein
LQREQRFSVARCFPQCEQLLIAFEPPARVLSRVDNLFFAITCF